MLGDVCQRRPRHAVERQVNFHRQRPGAVQFQLDGPLDVRAEGLRQLAHQGGEVGLQDGRGTELQQ